MAFQSARRLKVVLVSPEVLGFAKTGGLADVSVALPRALASRGHQCTIVTPLSRSARHGPVPLQATEKELGVPIGNKEVTGRLYRAVLPDTEVPVYLIEQRDYFERDDPRCGRGLYDYVAGDGKRRPYSDNSERYIFFCRAVLEALEALPFWPDILHCNDWQTGLIPVYLREVYCQRGDDEQRNRYANIATVLTIHNLAYQGLFWHWDMLLTGLDWRLFNYRELEFYGQLNFLKGGIVFADRVTTVSPRYAAEIQTPYFGCGLHGVLWERRASLSGIVNGLDESVWDPARDGYLAANYDAETVGVGKPICKADLQRRFNLAPNASTCVLGVVSRLVDQKGADLLCEAAEAMMQQDVQLVVLGEGNPVYERMFIDLSRRFPDRIGVRIGFDEALAHQIEAGADIFLMPSLYEPSGLNQLYSMRYGTVPVVRATGGLADTVIGYDGKASDVESATGFVFQAPSAEALLDALCRALCVFRNEPEIWRRLMMNGMKQDWSWSRSAAEYERIFFELQKERVLVVDGRRNQGR
ncbi:MAG: glycogen synthase [Gemmatales bacterium]|nr:MAG: glycogen synthase [Gemmatales bacterium]